MMRATAYTLMVAALLRCVNSQTGALDESVDNFAGENSGYLTPNPPPPPKAASSMTKTTPDACYFKSKGYSFDLREMHRLDHDYTGTTNGGYAYRFNVCGNTVKLCNQQPAPASKWRGSKCNNLGDPTTQTIGLIDEANPAKGVRLSFSKGDICKQQKAGQMEIGSRLVHFEVNCDPSAHPGELRLIKEVSMCEYTIVFDSMHGCPSNRSRIHGWALITLVTLALLTYCGVGYYLNNKNEGKQGVEAIPHVKYWEEVPGLVRDGVAFSYSHGKHALETGFTKGRGAYETIRDQYAARGAAGA